MARAQAAIDEAQDRLARVEAEAREGVAHATGEVSDAMTVFLANWVEACAALPQFAGEVGPIVARATSTWTEEVAQCWQRQASGAVEMAQELATCQDPGRMLELERAYLERSTQDLMDLGSRFSGLTIGLINECSQPATRCMTRLLCPWQGQEEGKGTA